MPAAPPDPPSWGIQAGYHDVWGRWRTPSPSAAEAIAAAIGPDPGTSLQVLRPGQRGRTEVTERAVVWLEDGTELRIRRGELPPDLPLGYHRIEAEAGRSAPHVEHLIVAPERAHLPDGWHGWGITAQLYAARSLASWGMGDLGDLERLARWADKQGAASVGLNPLHASAPGAAPANSPYSPSSRRWHEPAYLDVARLLAGSAVPDVDERIAAGRALNASMRIDRSATWAAKLSALEALWACRGEDSAFDAYRNEHGAALTLWGTYCAIAEAHGPSWTSWPHEYQRPDGPGVQRIVREQPDRVAFWCWLQHLTDEQLHTGAIDRVLVTDLAVGFSPDGFDAWQWQDLLATGCRIGAPPDLLGPDGQDWGLPPFSPARLRSVAYRPFVETLRANLRHGLGLRIDHVMGLLRLFWIPPGHEATDGAYVAWPGEELLDIVALESVRAGALVIGEDLGTVEPGVRTLLRDRGLLSTRLLWFEDDPPAEWPRQAMAAITTHDLPTVAGVWSGTDLSDLRAAGVTVPESGDEQFRHRLRVAAAVDDHASVEDIVVGAHRRIAEAPSMLVTAALDDLLGAEHRPNVPGTIDEHPNWRIALPLPIEDLATDPVALRVVEALRSAHP